MKKVFIRYILPILGIIAVVLLDQWTKYLTVTQIGSTGRIVLIEDVFELVYVKNNGMAWGLFQNQQLLFILMTPVVLFAMGFLYVRMPYEKKFIPMRVLLTTLAGGAIGNLLDRMFRGEFCQGHVVDMFYVKAIDFPVFNVADSFICVSFVVLVILVLFKYSEEDFDRMFKFGRKKENDAVITAKDDISDAADLVKAVKEEETSKK